MANSLLEAPIRLLARLVKPLRLARFPLVRRLYRWAYQKAAPQGLAEARLGSLKICVDPHDGGVGYQLYIGRGYEPLTTERFRAAIEPGMAVLDLGANVGYFTLLAAEGVGASGSVIAFEPEPKNCELLHKSLTANGFTHVDCRQQAASDTDEMLPLYVAPKGEGLHTIGTPDQDWDSIEVEAVRLDRVFPSERFDFIKMDIEGAEPRALAGMGELLGRCEGVRLLVEFNPWSLVKNESDAPSYLKQLTDLGFRIDEVVDEDAGTAQSMDGDAFLALCERRQGEVKNWSCNVFMQRG